METIRRPDLFIVGAPKCGTTAMNDFLGRHPAIFMCERKELHFFGSDLCFLKTPRISESKYLSYFSKATDRRRLGESSVWYLFSQNAAREIQAFNPRARIIMMLRNPVEMLYSLHGELLYDGYEDTADFATALGLEEKRRRGTHLPRDADLVQALYYRDAPKFSTQIQRYLDLFGWENVHIILLDDFKNHPEQVYAATLRFLEVDANFVPSFRVVNAAKKARSAKLSLWIRNILLAGQKFSMERLPEPALRSFPYRALRHGLIHGGRIAKALNTRYTPLSPMSPDLRRRLQLEFEPEVAKLSRLIDRDLSHWSEA